MLVDYDYLDKIYHIVEERSVYFLKGADATTNEGHFMLHSVQITIAEYLYPWLIPGLHPANERRRYFVKTPLISWVQTKNQPCISCDWEA